MIIATAIGEEPERSEIANEIQTRCFGSVLRGHPRQDVRRNLNIFIRYDLPHLIQSLKIGTPDNVARWRSNSRLLKHGPNQNELSAGRFNFP